MAELSCFPAGQIVRLPTAAGRSRHRTQVAQAIRRARQLSRADSSAFAARLQPFLDREGPTVTAALVTSWEEGVVVPPATVLLAVAAVAGVELELLFCPRTLLARLYELERQVRHQSQQLRGLQHRVICG